MTSRPVPPSFIPATETPTRLGSRYPAPYNEPCMARTKHILGDVFGLKQFGVNLVLLPPGCWSSQRHWHEKEDEFIYVVEGELTLCDNSGEHVLTAGMCAGFRAGNPNGHCLKNLSDKPAQYLEVGTRAKDEVAWYPEIGLKYERSDIHSGYIREDGSPP
jgi:uncharacterized cupin superfamily protein